MVDLIFINHLLFLHSLDCHDFTSFDMSANPYFAECSSSDNRKWLEIVCGDLLSHFPMKFSLLMKNVLFDKLLFCCWQVKILHLVLENIPCLFSVALILLDLLVLALYVGLGRLSSIFHTFGNLTGLMGGLLRSSSSLTTSIRIVRRSLIWLWLISFILLIAGGSLLLGIVPSYLLIILLLLRLVGSLVLCLGTRTLLELALLLHFLNFNS